ncbi:MAG: histidine kinase dimerization/phospho-acceptor domain-containing protein [Blastocatellia bacterium]
METQINEEPPTGFARLFAHELRTPLTSILGFAELMLEDESVSTEGREYLQIIVRESARLSETLNFVLPRLRLDSENEQEMTLLLTERKENQ